MPGKAAERAVALGDLDLFEFILAEKLGMTRGELGTRMSNQEYVEWAAFYTWRRTQEQHQSDMQAQRAR